MEWQAVAGLVDGTLIAERPDARPTPTVEVRELLPDGTEFKAVWSHLSRSGLANRLPSIFLISRLSCRSKGNG